MHHSQPLFVYYCLLLFLCRRTTLFSPLFLLVMAARHTLSSDPQFLLDLMHDLPDESDSEDDFDGYLEPDDGPVAYRREEFEERGRRSCSRRRSHSLESLTLIGQGPAPDSESLLAGMSPTYSPIQGHHSSGSPLAASTSPAQRYSGGCSSSLPDAAGGSSSLTPSAAAGSSSPSHSCYAAATGNIPPTLALLLLQATSPPTLALLLLQATSPPTLALLLLLAAAPPSPPRLEHCTPPRYCRNNNYNNNSQSYIIHNSSS